MKLKLFSFTVKDKFFPETFEGETKAATIQEAEEEIKDWYASELGTDHDDLIVTVKEVK
jgi:hypothetical protein